MAINISVVAHNETWLGIIVNGKNMGDVVLNQCFGVIWTGDGESTCAL